MRSSVVLLLLLGTSLCAARVVNSVDLSAPTQVHIAYASDPSQMSVTWSTVGPVRTPFVLFAAASVKQRVVPASSKLFVDGDDATHTQWIHKALLFGLRPATNYTYLVGSGNGTRSQVFSFISMDTNPNYAPRFVVFGDMGLVNPQSMPRLLRDMHANRMDAILHVGDFAYDMATNKSETGNAFMRMIQPLASRLPYMVSPGNHEWHYNFSNYKAFFEMPGHYENMYYSFDMGPIHFVSISTEYYYQIQYGIAQIKVQYDWLINDLKTANLPENRAKRPWIIMYGHRPMYCTNNDGDCGIVASLLRDGIPILNWFGVEKLLKEYGVDLAIWAHEHSYERMWPVYQSVIKNGSIPGQPYTDPGATVHVITGSAGCQEIHDHFGWKAPYSAFRSDDYGYSRMQVLNATHLTFEQVSDDKKGLVIDKFTLIRHKHDPFP